MRQFIISVFTINQHLLETVLNKSIKSFTIVSMYKTVIMIFLLYIYNLNTVLTYCEDK